LRNIGRRIVQRYFISERNLGGRIDRALSDGPKKKGRSSLRLRFWLEHEKAGAARELPDLLTAEQETISLRAKNPDHNPESAGD